MLQRSLDEPEHSRVALRFNSPGRSRRPLGAAPVAKKAMSTTILSDGSIHRAFAAQVRPFGPTADSQR